MKYTDGFWRYRDEFSVFNAVRVYEHEYRDGVLRLQVTHFDVQHRGQTLWGPLFELELSSPIEGVIDVKWTHFKGRRDLGPHFEIASRGFKGEFEESKDALVYKSGRLEARIARSGPWSMEFRSGGRLLTASGVKGPGCIQDGKGRNWMKEELGVAVGETLYGLGERFGPFVRNGQTVDMWNADGGTSSELAYKNVPLYLSSRGYGVFVDDCGPVSFELCSEKVERVQFSVESESLRYLVIDGPGLKDVLGRYTDLLGKPALPPAWSFGLWLTTSFVTDYDEKTVSSFVDGMAERDIPLEVFHFDCFWMRAYRWTDFEWDPEAFPDPKGFIARLKARGLKICVWINSYIAQRSRLFAEGMEKGYLLKRPDGSVWQADTWQPGMGMVDFTNPAARRWYASYLERLVDAGVDCFKTDFGERIPTDVAWHDGSDPKGMHNYYTQLYNKTVFEALKAKKGEGRALVFARSATAGGQKYPVHWGGDCTASYESMAESLRGGLSLGLSGFGFWSHDISGFEMTASADLYKRWSAFGLLSSHSRLHGNGSYRVPWLFDDEASEVLRFFVKLKCSLMPYVFRHAVAAAREGLPLMRAMILEFQDDPACAYLDRQYMLGPDILVAPVFSETGDVDYYLPAGIWTSLIDGKRVEGGRWLRETHGYMSLPLLARPGSLIAYGAKDDRPEYRYSEGAAFRLFELADGAYAHASIVEADGSDGLNLTVRRTGEAFRIEASGLISAYSIEVCGIECLEALGTRGVSVEKGRFGALLRVEAGAPASFEARRKG